MILLHIHDGLKSSSVVLFGNTTNMPIIFTEFQKPVYKITVGKVPLAIWVLPVFGEAKSF